MNYAALYFQSVADISATLAGDFACATPEGKTWIFRVTLSIADRFAQGHPAFNRSEFYRTVFGTSNLDLVLTKLG